MGQAGHWGESLAVRVEHTRFEPCADEPEAGPIGDALPQPGHQPRLISMVNVALDVRFHHRAIRAKVPMTCAVSARISCPNLLPVAIAACTKGLLVESVQSPHDRRLEACVLWGGNAPRAQGALALRDGVPSDQFSSGARRLHALPEGGDMGLQTFPLGSCTAAVYP